MSRVSHRPPSASSENPAKAPAQPTPDQPKTPQLDSATKPRHSPALAKIVAYETYLDFADLLNMAMGALVTLQEQLANPDLEYIGKPTDLDTCYEHLMDAELDFDLTAVQQQLHSNVLPAIHKGLKLQRKEIKSAELAKSQHRRKR